MTEEAPPTLLRLLRAAHVIVDRGHVFRHSVEFGIRPDDELWADVQNPWSERYGPAVRCRALSGALLNRLDGPWVKRTNWMMDAMRPGVRFSGVVAGLMYHLDKDSFREELLATFDELATLDFDCPAGLDDADERRAVVVLRAAWILVRGSEFQDAWSESFVRAAGKFLAGRGGLADLPRDVEAAREVTLDLVGAAEREFYAVWTVPLAEAALRAAVPVAFLRAAVAARAVRAKRKGRTVRVNLASLCQLLELPLLPPPPQGRLLRTISVPLGSLEFHSGAPPLVSRPESAMFAHVVVTLSAAVRRRHSGKGLGDRGWGPSLSEAVMEDDDFMFWSSAFATQQGVAQSCPAVVAERNCAIPATKTHLMQVFVGLFGDGPNAPRPWATS